MEPAVIEKLTGDMLYRSRFGTDEIFVQAPNAVLGDWTTARRRADYEPPSHDDEPRADTHQDVPGPHPEQLRWHRRTTKIRCARARAAARSSDTQSA